MSNKQLNKKYKKAVLMSKNTPLLGLLLEKNNVKEIICIKNEDKLPFLLKDNLNEKTLNYWINKRLISNKREGFDEVKKVFGNFDDYGAMFSLTDQYWFSFGSQQKWEDGNFFNQRYDRNFGYMFFYPWEVEKSHIKFPSPDMTTNGVTRKRWIQYKNSYKSYLIKSRDQDGIQDPINEVIASKYLKKLKFIDVVEYDLIIDGLRFCSKCPNFIDENTEFVPASHLCATMPKNSDMDFYDFIIKKCDEFNLKNSKDYLDRMITADYIIKNVDRHYGNFGFIRDVESGKLVDFAPLFDFGLSFTKTSPNKKKKTFFSEQRIKNALEYTSKKYNIDIKPPRKDTLMEVLNYYPFIHKK